MVTSAQDQASPGWLVPIGGNLNDAAIYDRFVELAGGPNARIAVIPTASSLPTTFEKYRRAFAAVGVREVREVAFRRRNDCDDRDWLAYIEEADAVFVTGGDQLRIASVLGGTPAEALLRERFQRGMPVAGTSAGAAWLSRHMIARGAEGPSPVAGMVTIAAGIGLAEEVIVDQHFRQRDRLGRLLTAIAYHPGCVGLGVDEDTAAFIAPDGSIEVVGKGAVTVIDPADLEHSSVADVEHGEVVSLVGIEMHLLGAGAIFHLHSRTVITPQHGPRVDGA